MDDDDLTIEEPTATGWLRAEFYGDTDHAQALLHTARTVLGAMKTFYGINARIAEGEPGGMYRHAVKMADGSVIEALHNNGHDMLRIHAVPRPVDQEQPRQRPVPPAPEKVELPQPEHVAPPAVETPPPPVPRRIEVERTEDEEIWPAIEDAAKYNLLWIAFFDQNDSASLTLRAWALDERDFTGDEIVLSSGARVDAVTMFGGWVYAAALDDFNSGAGRVYRKSIASGQEQTIYSGSGMYDAIFTATPHGVLAVFNPDGQQLTMVQFDRAGGIVWQSSMDHFGGPLASCVCDGQSAHLFRTSTNEGSAASINADTGAGSDTSGAWELAAESAIAAAVGSDIFGVRQVMVDGVSDRTEVFMRSGNGAVETLADLTQLAENGNSLVFPGPVTATDNGKVVATTNLDVVVVDAATLSLDVDSPDGLWGITVDREHYEGFTVPACGVLAGTSLAALILTEDTEPAQGAGVFAYHLCLLDTETGATDSYELGIEPYCYGYVVQYIFDDEDDENAPTKEEWEYRAATNSI